MKLLSVTFIFFLLGITFGQWASRVHLVDFEDYYHRVMTEAVHELEELGWSNFKLADHFNEIDQQMYRWHVTGSVNYTNGFLVSIEKIDISNVVQQMSTRTVDGVVQNVATVHGRMNFRDFKIGYDVLATIDDDGQHRYTGIFVHALASFQFWVVKNLHTQEISGQHSFLSLTSGLGRMIYMPANHLTQVISRTYTPSQISSSVNVWARDIILPVIVNVANSSIEFPERCLDCR